ncbi:MAG: hypothetical protein Q7T54_00445 [Candidatus Levybacteria bacterium]|nr:hypothetical protein [Candidatus Levybacteria bacterium]
MAGILSFIFVIALIALPISIIKPQIFSRFFNATRTKNAMILGGILSVLFVLIAITAPTPTKDSTNANDTDSMQPTKSVDANPTQTTIEDLTPAPTETPTPTPTEVPTPIPTKIVKPTAEPTKKIVYPTSTPIPVVQAPAVIETSGGYSCNCSKTCPQISSCDEAQYLLNECGCGARDGDDDGIACDGAPLNCQN